MASKLIKKTALFVGGIGGIILIIWAFMTSLKGERVPTLVLIFILIGFMLSTWGWKGLMREKRIKDN